MSDPIKGVFESITPTEQQKAKMYREIMNSHKKSQNIEPIRYRKRGGWLKYLAASVFVILVSTYAFTLLNKENTAFALYAYETNTELTSTGAELSTGMIDDSGSMKGNLLQFSVKGKNIEDIRFSVKHQYMDFTDWTENRPSHSMEKQFTIAYGDRSSDYEYLVVDWKPELTIRELTDHSNRTIAGLAEQLRSDIIVMEIAFTNGTTATKALYVTIQTNGKVMVKLQDYSVTDNDFFILKPSQVPLPIRKPEKVIEPNEYADAKYSEVEIQTAEKVAHKYYAKFPKDREIVKINYMKDVKHLSSFISDEYKNWQIIAFEAYEKSMYPDAAARHIVLAREDASKEWIVINEGY
ncbi:hypothetical protein [Paenibacillus sp. NEAU-GSW1]|uniref:hypothetical protein n=1 Tax=Paenibacillus sp. NEAU-GSW1 TaxID=2682486 RepID=UPI0012E14812|nr:hypothetical protein [Paenibacillus sp. NEAU-GSW1]MUT68353.1 hypothetical protein [Paenibacillus sp. NEAU-GSW1]